MTAVRERIMNDLRTAMKAGDSTKVAQLRGITAKLKDLDVAARATQKPVEENEIFSAMRSMVKSRTESAEMYEKAGRPELAEKERGEIEAIKTYLPPELGESVLEESAKKVIAESGAASMKDMGKVMGGLKAVHGAALDPAKASAVVKKLLGAG